MLNISYDFDEEFCELYNSLNQNQKKKKFLNLTGIDRDKLDVCSLSKDYFLNNIQSVTIDANANVGSQKSPSNYLGEIMKGPLKLDGFYILWKYLKGHYGVEEANRLIRKVIEGWYYIHDCSGAGLQAPYCFAYSTMNVLTDGRPYGQLQSKAPKRFSSFVGQVIETTMDFSQEFMGAIAVGDFFVNCAYFTSKENIPRKTIKNEFQRFVHVLNNPFRLSSQSPFTNVSLFDSPSFRMLFKDVVFPDGSKAQEYEDEVMRLQEIFMEFMSEKDPVTHLPYRFPVTTANINVDEKTNEPKDKNFLKLVSKYNVEGIFNIFVTRGVGKIASCCRLINDVDAINAIGSNVDSFGNGGINVGSARVITLNLARIGKIADGDEERYREVLNEQMEDIKKLLDTHRYLLKKRIERNYLKFFTLGWVDIDRHLYSTFGVNGLYESVKFMGLELSNDNNRGIALAKKIMLWIKEKVNSFIKEEDGKVLYNIEQVPAEQVAVNLAKKDSVYFNQEDDYPFGIYANQFVPLWHKVDLWERAKLDGDLCEHFTGGHISHLNIGSAVTPNQMEKLIHFAIESKLEHFALNPVFSQCENGHTNLTNSDVCPVCGGKNIEKVTRIIGYFVPISSWNDVRKDWEYPRRKFLKLGEGRTINTMKEGGEYVELRKD